MKILTDDEKEALLIKTMDARGSELVMLDKLIDITHDGNIEAFLKAHPELFKSAPDQDGIVGWEYLGDPSKYFETYIDEHGQQRKRFATHKLAESVMNATNFKTLKGSKAIYFYQNGVYRHNGDEEIRRLCAARLKEIFTVHMVNECISYIQSLTFIDPEAVSNEWLNLENGLINPLTGEFKPHTPEVFSIKRMPVVYDPAADCPVFKEKLLEKVGLEIYNAVQEMFGYTLLPGQKFEKAFLLYGPMRTMKSTTLFALERMLGDENITSFSLQYLTSNPFALAYLYGIPANICADLSSASLRDTGAFMEIVGGDKITAAKKHEHPITFYPDTKLIFSCNVIPATTNKHLAFYRRWDMLPFMKQTPDNEIDTGLRAKIEKEIPGIFNWSMEGLKRLIEHGGFTGCKSPEEIKDIYERNSDTIASFAFNEIDVSVDEGRITKREVYSAYKRYCDANDLMAENVIKFGRWFKEHTGCGTGKLGEIPAYTGVSFKITGGDKQTILHTE